MPVRPRSSATALCALALALTACSASGGDDARTAAGTADRELRVAGQFEVHSLDPALAGGAFSRLGVAETLVDADREGALRPGLATSWEPSDDGLTWTFALREGATFHDGTPVTAEQAVAALDRARAQEGTPLTTVPWRGVAARDGAVVVTLARPFAALPAVLAHTSAQVLAASSYAQDGSVTSVVGSGPYAVTDVRVPSSVELEASEHWDGPAPEVRRVAYQTAGRAESRTLLAESRQADVVFGMDPTSVQRLRGRDGLDVVSATLPRTILLKINSGHPFLSAPEVRRALSLALDRDAMAGALLRDPEMAATQLFPPSLADWHDDGLAPLAHDPAEARDLLAGAGWEPGEDGVLRRDGERFAVTLRTYPDRPELPVVATAVQAALREVGVAVEVAVGNSSGISAGHEDGTLELGLYARNFSLVPDPLVTLLEDFDADGADFGPMGWSDERVAAALADLADGAPEEQAARRRAEVAAVLQEELPVVPVAWYRQSVVVSDRVAGLELDPLERDYALEELSWRA